MLPALRLGRKSEGHTRHYLYIYLWAPTGHAHHVCRRLWALLVTHTINPFSGWLRNRTGTGNRNRRNRSS